nr:MAG: hypothetical protein 3 [Leviviridae sp.]
MLVKALLADASLDLDLSVQRDVATLQRRCEHEGFSFLAITLPTLSDALERGLECGTFTCPSNFARHGSLPRFLGGFFKRVFTIDGRLREDACPNSVYWIRQICRFFKKPKIGCSEERNLQAIQAFLNVEGELRRMTAQVERKDEILDKVSGIIWAQVFPELDYHSLVCHHGPGVTADRCLPNERHFVRQWYDRSEFSYPSDLHGFPNYGVAAEFSSAGTGVESDPRIEYIGVRDEFPVRVVFVPKTLTAPRVIAIEPHNVQFMQQSLKDFMYERIEEHKLTKNSIRFVRQDVNRRLAYSSSIDKRLATLDLKDASDRVHLHLVQRIFKTSGILEYLEDARSLHATLPNEKNIVLFKYASMGSALCFPVEACVFYTLIQSAMHQLDGRRPSSSSIRHYSRLIDIYGDDIIVPVEYADTVVRYLESYALKVNVNKSFKEGNFRESCGADHFKGVDVKPIYAREIPHDDLRQWGAEEVMSWTATSNLFYMKGLWHTAEAIRTLLCRVVRRTIPKSTKVGSGVFFYSFFMSTDLRFDEGLQTWKQRRVHYDPVKRKDSIDGNELACLNKWGQHVHARELRADPYGRDTKGLRRFSRYISGFSGGMLEARGGGNSFMEPSPFTYPTYAIPDCDAGPQYGYTDVGIRANSVCKIPYLYDRAERNVPPVSYLVGSCNANCKAYLRAGNPARARSFEDLQLDYCLIENFQSDPLAFLSGNTTGLDFLTSTKRGSFKSKCRWVSLAG